jgi:hypothetical protein
MEHAIGRQRADNVDPFGAQRFDRRADHLDLLAAECAATAAGLVAVRAS